MTDTATAWGALAFHQGDWMKKALDASDLSAKGMAEYLGVEPETVSRWLNAKRTPSLQTLRLWAMRTGVPLSYLKTGELPSTPDDGGGISENSEEITVWLLAPNVTQGHFGQPRKLAAAS